MAKITEHGIAGDQPRYPLADEVLRMIHAFNLGDSRRADIRDLALRVSNVERTRDAAQAEAAALRERLRLAKAVCEADAAPMLDPEEYHRRRFEALEAWRRRDATR